jgi:hypothetical protein
MVPGATPAAVCASVVVCQSPARGLLARGKCTLTERLYATVVLELSGRDAGESFTCGFE